MALARATFSLVRSSIHLRCHFVLISIVAIRFVLSDAYTSMSREERQALLHEGVSTTTTLSAYGAVKSALSRSLKV